MVFPERRTDWGAQREGKGKTVTGENKEATQGTKVIGVFVVKYNVENNNRIIIDVD